MVPGLRPVISSDLFKGASVGDSDFLRKIANMPPGKMLRRAHRWLGNHESGEVLLVCRRVDDDEHSTTDTDRMRSH